MNTGFPSVVLVSQKRSVVLDCLLLVVGLFILSACQARGVFIKPQATPISPTPTQDQPVTANSSTETSFGFCPDTLTFATGFATAQADEMLVVISNFADPQGNDPHNLTPDLVGRMREMLSTYTNIRVEQLGCAINPQGGNETALRIGSREDVQATILIWGLYATPAESSVRISFNIVKEKESYLGAGFDRSLGPQAIQPRSFAVEADLGAQMNEMVAFASGVVMVNANEYLTAEPFFATAISATDPQPDSGFARLLHLYRGINDLYLGRALDAINELEQLQPAQTVTNGAFDSLDLPLLNALGLAYSASGGKQKALEHFDQALSIYQSIGDKAGEARVLSNIGLAYVTLGEMQKALERFNQAVPLYEALRDKVGKARVLTRIGFVYFNLGEMQKAIEYYDKAMPLYEDLGDKAGKAWVLSNIGDAYIGLNEIQKALAYYEQALPLSQSIGDKAGEARAITMLGVANSFLGENELALKYYEQALPLLKGMSNKLGEARILNSIGDIYSDQFEGEKALAYYEQALPLSQSIGDKPGEASTLAKIGKAYSDQGEIQKAMEYYDQAISLYQSTGDKAGEASIFTQIGNFFFSKGEWQKAIEYYEQAIPLYQLAGDKASEASTLTMIANSYSTLENSQKAIESMNHAVDIYHSIGDPSSEVKALDWLAVLQFLHNDLDGAAATLEIAIDLATEIDHPMLPMLQGLLDEINTKRNE